MIQQRKASRVTLDIETWCRVGLFFGPEYKAVIGKVILEGGVFGFSWKPYHKKVQSCYIWDFPLYKKDPLNDIEVVKKWLEVVSENDIVIGQNSRSFDDKVMMGRVIYHKLPPPLPFYTVDTMADTKKIARYDSNRLDWISKQRGQGGKHETGGIDLWWDCMTIPGFKKSDPKAQRKMVRYCENDVIKTEQRYDWEFPYYKNHPPLNAMEGKPAACKHCGVEGKLTTAKKYRSTKTGIWKEYYRCRSCRGMSEAVIPANKVGVQFV